MATVVACISAHFRSIAPTPAPDDASWHNDAEDGSRRVQSIIPADVVLVASILGHCARTPSLVASRIRHLMCIDAIGPALSSAATAGWLFLNSNIAIALVGGFTGAIGGALGAQRIAERSRKRDERLKELRQTNAAIMVAHTICNAALALKKQHVQPMRAAFLKSKADLAEFKRQRDAKQIAPDQEFHVQMELSTYPAPALPIETLKRIVFQELSAVGRPLALVAAIDQSLIGLSAAIEQRDRLIQKFAAGEIPEETHPHFYFGLPLPGGHLHKEYPDLVEAIFSYNDDVAFFSYQLCNDLMKHGAKVKEGLTKNPSKRSPNVSEIDFSGPLKSGLLPPESQYRDWVNAFVERPEK